MSLDDFYILRIQSKKKGNMEIFNQLLLEMFGKLISWGEVKSLPREDQMKLTIELENKIKINESPYDIKKLARAIQHSRSGIGGSAMTPYQCDFCGEGEVWVNTATPGICGTCATKMAKNIVLYGMDLTKD